MDLRHDMLTHGVNVVTASHEGRLGGLAVGWATQIATDRVLICIGKQSATREMIISSGAFGLSVLKREQIDIATLFGTQSSREVDKFTNLAWHTAETGSPLLDDCAAAIDCRVEAVYDREDGHKLIIGRVVAVEYPDRESDRLTYREEDYK